MITEKEAIELLKKYSTDERSFKIVLNHVKEVQRVALRIASKINGVDIELIRIGSLLHDIGRFAVKGQDPTRHGMLGGEILRKEGLKEFASIAETHVGVGIKKEDIEKQGLDLPLRDFVPETKEEKIIAHADNLVFGDKEVKFEMVLDKYRKELGEEYVERLKRFKKEIEKMMG